MPVLDFISAATCLLRMKVGIVNGGFSGLLILLRGGPLGRVIS